MRNLIKKIILLLIVSGFSVMSNAQFDAVTNIISGGVNDAEQVLGGYISPYMNAIGANLNAGWYNTAKPHKLGGFDLTFTFNMGFVPETDKTFDLSQLNLMGTINGDPVAPTAAGDRDNGPTLLYTETVDLGGGNTEVVNIAEYETPKGLGVGFIPMPMAQLGIGLIKGTEIVGRYFPTVSLGDYGELGLWGIGVKHSIKQWIPVIDKIPFLEISAFGGYTKFKSTVNLSMQPSDLNFGTVIVEDRTSGIAFDDQSMDMNISAFNMNLLVGANLPFICFYAGVGYANTKSNLTLAGNYPIPEAFAEGTEPVIAVTNDSVGEDIELIKDNKNGSVRLNAGLRIKLGVITIHGDYTKAEYSSVSAGIGISFR